MYARTADDSGLRLEREREYIAAGRYKCNRFSEHRCIEVYVIAGEDDDARVLSRVQEGVCVRCEQEERDAPWFIYKTVYF